MGRGMNKNLGFREGEGIEKMGGIGEVWKLFVDRGIIRIGGFMSGRKEMGEMAGNIMGKDDFVEV